MNGNTEGFYAFLSMDKPPFAKHIETTFFLARLGKSLRRVTQDVIRDELPANKKHVLVQLDRLEVRIEKRLPE